MEICAPVYRPRRPGESPLFRLVSQHIEKETPKKRRCTPSWARLISKVYNVDPLTCRTCGGKLKVIACITVAVAIGRILDALGLSPPKESKPPPAPHEVVQVPLNEEGWEIGDHS